VISLSTGSPGTFRDSIVRNSLLAGGLVLLKIPLVGWVFLLLVLVLEFLLIIGNKEGMRLGDDLADTKVLEG
jgi:hypothetical protein